MHTLIFTRLSNTWIIKQLNFMKMLKYLNVKFEQLVFEFLALYTKDDRCYVYFKILIINMKNLSTF